MSTTAIFIAQSPIPTQQPSQVQATQQSFDPGLATIWAAWITAGVSLVVTSTITTISIINQNKIENSRKKLQERLEEERKNHEIFIENLRLKNEEKIAKLSFAQERRLRFIGSWRNILYKDNLTYEDIFKERSYKTLASFMSPEVLRAIQDKSEEIKLEQADINKKLNYDYTAWNFNSIIWDESTKASEIRECENHSLYLRNQYSLPEEIAEFEAGLNQYRIRIEQLNRELSAFIKEQLIEEIRRLEMEEWGLL